MAKQEEMRFRGLDLAQMQRDPAKPRPKRVVFGLDAIDRNAKRNNNVGDTASCANIEPTGEVFKTGTLEIPVVKRADTNRQIPISSGRGIDAA